MLLSSRQNPTIKRLAELREAKARREQGLFLLDGPREIERALAMGKKIVSAYHCADFPFDAELLKSLKAVKVEIVEVTKPAFEAIAYRENPYGLIAEARTWSTELSALQLNKPTLIIVAEDIEKPGNLGTLLRTADAVGAQAIIGCNPTVDLFNPNTLRGSAGAAFSVPYATASLAQTMAYLKANNLKLVATSPAAKKELWQVDLKGPVAIAVGSEAKGLTDEFLKCATETISLPMKGVGDSLNVSVASGVVLYEVLRQRKTL